MGEGKKRRWHTAQFEGAVDLSLDDAAVDLVAQGCDAGIRLGQSVEQDMVAVRLGGEPRRSMVAVPDHLARRGRRRFRRICSSTQPCATASTPRARCLKI